MVSKGHFETDSWAALLKTYNKTLHKIMKDLKNSGLPTLEAYDVMWCLEREKNHQLRLIEIAEKVDLEKYNVTRIVDKLCSEGLIEKVPCEEDKRGSFACLTEDGKALRGKMWQVYKKSIVTHFGSHLSEKENLQLIELMKKIK